MDENISVTPKKKLSKKKIALFSVLGVLLLIILTLFILYRIAVSKVYDNSVPVVDREEYEVKGEEGEEVPIYEQEPIETDTINILIVGTDSRDPDSDQGRSDTMMLLSYNRKEEKATMVSFLRDSLVPIEGHGQTRLNHAFAYGGIGMTINTLNDNFGLDIQDYVLLNFDNLEGIVDDMGGVSVNITKEEVEYYKKTNNVTFVEGMNTLNGEQALMHARMRYLDSDFGRTRRQRDIMFAVYKKVMEDKSPSNISKLVSACLGQVRTNMEPNQLFSYAMEIVRNDELDINQIAVPAEGTWSNTKYKGMAVLQLDIEENKKIIHEALY